MRTNIKQQLTPPPLSLNCSKRSVDSGNNFKATDANAPPLWNQLTYSHFSEELTSLMRSSWNLTWRTGSADNCSDSSVAGGNCGSSTISSANSAEHEGSWIRGSGWEVGDGRGSCTSEAVSIEPTVLWWSPRHCLQTPAYKNKPKMSFGSIVVYEFVATLILNSHRALYFLKDHPPPLPSPPDKKRRMRKKTPFPL